MNNIYLIGMMGSGKSVVGQALSNALDRSYIDSDRAIEQSVGKSVKEIFEQKGEEYFRQLEHNVLKEVATHHQVVVSCGGGAILDERNIKIMQKTGTIIYIYRDIQEILRTIHTDKRPLLTSDGSNIQALFIQREATYERAGDIKVDNDSSVSNAVVKILKALRDESIIN